MSPSSLPREVPLHETPQQFFALKRLWSIISARWGAIPILLAFIFANLTVSPLYETPMIDDWSYALTVRRLVEDHELQMLGWSAVTLFAQILWGALFSIPFGFSFGALHLSTAVLALAGLLALYEAGRELGLGEGKSALVALTFWVNPLYLSLSYTFMTDVPSTALTSIALWLYIVAARRRDTRWWLLGSLACTAAFLTRQTGIFVGLGAGIWLLSQGPRAREAWKDVLAAAGLPVLTALGFSLWFKVFSAAPEGYTYNLSQLAKLPPEVAIRNVLTLLPVSLFYLGLFCLPYLAGLRSSRRLLLQGKLALAALICVAALAFLLFRWFGSPMPYLHYGSMLTPAGIGPNNLLGERAVVLGQGELWLLTALAGIGAAALLTIALRRARIGWLFEPSPVGLVGLVALAQLSWVLFGYLYLWDWFLFDRYYLPVLAPALLLLAAATARARFSWLRAAPVLAIFALFSLLGTHDWIAFRQTTWSAAQALVDSGVPLRSIDAGFEWDGWQLYEFSQAHPEEWHHADASPFWIGRRVAPVINSEYVIAFSPLDGYSVVRAVPYSSWLTFGEDLLYVQHKEKR